MHLGIHYANSQYAKLYHMGKPHPDLYGWSVNDLVERCKVNISTARRWKRGAFCPPETALMILRRDLGCFEEKWKGWTINGGDIVSPDGWVINRNHALTVPLMHGQISAYRQKVALLEKQLRDAGGVREMEWELEVKVGPPGQLRTLKARLSEFNDQHEMLPRKAAEK